LISRREGRGETQIEAVAPLLLEMTALGNRYRCKIFVACRRSIALSTRHFTHVGSGSLDAGIDRVRNIHEWVLFAKRPLTAAGLEEAMGNFGPTKLLELFRTSCHGLIDTEDETVYFNHELPKDCLLKLIHKQFYHSRSLEKSAHSRIA
jgi:hypothetical protein